MGKIMGIKAVSFDADGTLWNFNKVMRLSLQRSLLELERIDPSTAAMLNVDKMIDIRERVAEEMARRTPKHEQIRLEAFRRALREIGRPDEALAGHLTEVYLKHRFEDIEPYDDALPALRALGKRYKLGILSNGNSYPERCGLGGVFQFTVFSQDHGVEKPDPRIFRITLERAGCSKDELLHVGDLLESDVKGAFEAGVKCVWLNRQGLVNDTNFKADYEVSSLLGLLEIL
jgi:putative hydrolase of the HAD superfamily